METTLAKVRAALHRAAVTGYGHMDKDLEREIMGKEANISNTLGPSSITIQSLVTIRPNGVIEYGPDYTPDAAEKVCQDDESGRDGGGYYAEIIRALMEGGEHG